MKLIVYLLKKAEFLSAVSVRLTYLTGKSSFPIHPKHLVPEKLWFEDKLKKTDEVLDLGCNSGQISFKVASKVKKVIGVDINEELINRAKDVLKSRSIKNILFLQLDANEKLPFNSNQFTKVICSDVLEHLENRTLALKEIYRVLKPKGKLFLVTDNPNTSWKRWQKKMGFFYYADLEHKYEYPKKEIVKTLEKYKFSIDFISSVTFNTPLAPFIDLVGGISLNTYKRLRKWREDMNRKYPEDSTGYRIIAIKR